MSTLGPPVGDEHKANNHLHKQKPRGNIISHLNAKFSSADAYFSLAFPVIQLNNDDVDEGGGLRSIYSPLHSRLYLSHAVFTVVGSVPH